jgi:shikimate kinase
VKRFATVLIGHRGVGKSALLRQLGSPLTELNGGPAAYFDLDQEIQSRTGQKISELFAGGEAEFREVEKNILKELVQKAIATGQSTLIAAGAGIQEVPKGAHVVWLRRSSDAAGRVFADRPRLNVKVSPFAEYQERFLQREERYRTWADEELWVPEGYELGMEEFFAGRQDWLLPYELTLLAGNFRDWPGFWAKRRNWSLRHVEVRDDLLSEGEIQIALRDVPAEHIIYAHRRVAADYAKILAKHKVRFDWPLEMGPAPREADIVSLHERSGDLDAAITGLNLAVEAAAAHGGRPVLAKLAVQIQTFEELEDGHRWWQESPDTRAFLPRSLGGRWQWYRALFGRKMPLHFFREGDGSGLDQPYLWHTLHQPVMHNRFAAVLGSPIDHSRSPAEHHNFFREFGVPMTAVEVNENEWDTAWPVLANLGMVFAAVTSPLKNKASAAVGAQGPVNTLWLEEGRYQGANTDAPALAALAEENRGFRTVWLWGAGAMRSNVESAFSRVRVVSARGGTEEASSPELLIWATGRSREFKWPPSGIKPKLVLDLNYSEESPGLEFAVLHGLPYQSGLRLFKLQAELQRQKWRRTLEIR